MEFKIKVKEQTATVKNGKVVKLEDTGKWYPEQEETITFEESNLNRQIVLWSEKVAQHHQGNVRLVERFGDGQYSIETQVLVE